MVTGILGTLINIGGAGGPTPARGTHTLIPLAGLSTAPSVGAGVGQTGMLRPLTVDSRVALRAGALVLVWSSVAACPPVQAWLVGGTEVQVFVTEMSSPVGFAEALPGLHAGAMHTARVGDTLITVLTLPAIQTLAATWL